MTTDHQQMTDHGRRKDKAWLLWDLLYRKREMKASATRPSRDPFMRSCDWYAYDRFERMIAIVREINDQPNPTTPEQAALDAYWAAKTPAEVRAAVERLTALGMWKGEGPMPRLMRKGATVMNPTTRPSDADIRLARLILAKIGLDPLEHDQVWIVADEIRKNRGEIDNG